MLSYTAPKATVQQLLFKHYSPPEAVGNLHVQKVLHRLKICRTAWLGYHVYRCMDSKATPDVLRSAFVYAIYKVAFDFIFVCSFYFIILAQHEIVLHKRVNPKALPSIFNFSKKL